MSEAVEADRVIVINDGEIFMDDTPRRVFSRVAELQSVGLDVPQVTELAYELTNAGAPLGTELLTTAEAGDSIARWLTGKE